jgi:NADPH:quinone reductase-like Zn-dependent oxidoreductase
MPSAKPPTKLYTLPAGFNPPRLIIPTQQTAIVQGEKGKASIRHDVALPVPEPHQVLVKTVAVSINPCDWKMPTKFPSPGSRIGSDFVGKVIAIGPECKAGVKLGDRVCGGIHGSNPIDPVSGAFAQYVAGHDDFLLKLPNHISWEDGAVLGGSVFATLRLALYESLGLVGMPGKPVEERPSPPVLVYGGSTSTGTMAIQILKLYAYPPSFVISVLISSPRFKIRLQSNHDLLTFEFRAR